jgi:hypothetical protein
MIKFFCMCICLFYGIFRIGLNGAPINLTIYMANGIQYLVKGTTVIYYLGKVKGLASIICSAIFFQCQQHLRPYFYSCVTLL